MGRGVSRIKICHDTGNLPANTADFYKADAFSASGTRVFLDGQEVTACRGIDLHIAVDDMVTAKVDVIATEALDVEIDASVNLNVTTFDEFDIEETPMPDGGRRLRAVRREPQSS